MRMKRLLAAALACCTALSSVPFLSAFADGGEEAASPDLVFDFQTTDGSNEVTVSTQSLAAGDQSVPVKLCADCRLIAAVSRLKVKHKIR